MKGPSRPKIRISSVAQTTVIAVSRRMHQQRMANGNSSDLYCLDFQNNTVPEGQRYASSEDPCFTCTCISGAPNLCISVLCQQPTQCSELRQIEGKCCEFECFNDTHIGNYTISGVLNDIPRFNPRESGLHLVALCCTIAFVMILAFILQLRSKYQEVSPTRSLESICVHSGTSPQVQDHRLSRYSSDSDSQNVYHARESMDQVPTPPPPYFGEQDNEVSPWKQDVVNSENNGFDGINATSGQETYQSANDLAPPPSYEQLFNNNDSRPLAQVSQESVTNSNLDSLSQDHTAKPPDNGSPAAQPTTTTDQISPMPQVQDDRPMTIEISDEPQKDTKDENTRADHQVT